MRTVDALAQRVEALDSGAPEESAMARALAGMHQELARRTRSLEESEATYRALYEGCPDPLLTVDVTGLILACNRTAHQWLGVTDLVGRSLSSLFSEGAAANVDRLVGSGWTGVTDQRFLLLDGRVVSLNSAPIPGGASLRYHLTVRDVTTRHVLDEAEVQRRKMAALAELAGLVARELNDPMSIVQGRLELMVEIGDTEQRTVERHMGIALQHARRVSATLRNLRLVGTTGTPRIERVQVSEVITDALDLVGSRQDRVNLTVDVEPADLAAGGDAAVYARVLANLIARTLDGLSRGGAMMLRARRRDEEVVIQILCGARFVRLDQVPTMPPTDDAQTGGELGLSIAHTLLTSFGGRLDDQRLGGTAVLTVRLPRPPATRARARPVENTLLVVGRAEVEQTLAHLLSRDGFAVHRVADAEAALIALERDKPEALVAELLLPGMSGLTLVEEIDRRFPWLNRRTVLVTDARLEPSVPASVQIVHPPLRRAAVLAALGRRVRRRR
jgi:PAS domain S-box-containing protein